MMGYLDEIIGLNPKEYQINQLIDEFLISEGFKWDNYPWDWSYVRKLTSDETSYVVWICVHHDHIYWQAEHDCGGQVDSGAARFNKDKINWFMGAYKNVAISARKYLKR